MTKKSEICRETPEPWSHGALQTERTNRPKPESGAAKSTAAE